MKKSELTEQAKKNKKNKQRKEVSSTEVAQKPSIANYRKCCTCRYRSVVKQCAGKTSPKLGQYVARKLEACACYKCKVD